MLFFSRVEIVVLIILEHGLGSLFGKLHSLFLSVFAHVLHDFLFVATNSFVSPKSFLERVLLIRVFVNDGLDTLEHFHVIDFFKNFQLDDQGLTKSPSSWTLEAKHELILSWSN